MRIRLRAPLAVALTMVAVPLGVALAAPADTTATQYALITPPSALVSGCFGPCACPVDSQSTYGSFVLVPLGSDPQYTNYAVERFIASFNNGPGAVSITGSGTYQTGGEFAATQRLQLDLQVWGGPVQHFDSGVQTVHVAFPQLDVRCSERGFAACFDSILHVAAKPVGVTAAPAPPGRPAGIASVRPNPFGAEAAIAFRVDRAGPVELSVVDLQGRRLRTLTASASMSAGDHLASWDGRDERGRVVRAGVYWLTMTWTGGADRRRIVKLD